MQNPSVYGIDEVYFHPGFEMGLLKKLEMRASFTLDSFGFGDTLLIFYKRTPESYLIKKFIKTIQGNEEYIRSNTLLNEQEVFEAIKSKNYVLVSSRPLSRE